MPTAILDTKKAAEKRLKMLLPTAKIAWEGVAFTPPNNEIYYRTQFVIQDPEDPVIGDKYYREIMSFQVFVCDVLNKGTTNAFTKAEEIRASFYKGLTLSEGATSIYVLSTPRVAGSIPAEDRLVVPVLIELVAEVYT